jgi:hypothetical protein
MKSRLLAVLSVLAIAPSIYSQEFRGAISGAVKDASGAVVVGAKITVLETNTNTKVETVSDQAGHYSAPFLLPGDYDVTAKMAGFKEYVRKGLHLGAGENPIIDIALTVGETTQVMEVTDVIPLINNENASIGQTITTKEVEDLPTNGGSPMMLASFAMGVTPTAQPTQVLPFASGGSASWSIGGSPSQTNELLVDGVPNATWDGRLAYSPPQDSVQEVRVKAFDSDAAYGHTGGGTANMILKSGSNALHGVASWKNQPNTLTANTFFNNKTGVPATVTHFNQYGITASGPVYLPKVFNGRDKMFWMFAFEGVQSKSPNSSQMSVPTAAQRTGDFSQLLSIKSPVVIYDPATAVTVNNVITRTAFPSNKIPSNRINSIATKYLNFFPSPNVVNSSRDDGYYNYSVDTPTSDGYTNELGRLDYNFNAQHRSYFNVRHTDYYQSKNNYFSNLSTGSNLSRQNWGSTFDHVYMVNARNVVNVRANFTRMFEDHSSPNRGVNPVEYGFPSYMASRSLYPQLPTMTFASNTAVTSLGFGSNANILPSQSLQLFGNWVAIRGAHNLKFGGDLRLYRLNYRTYGNSAGTFAFSANSWVRAASNSSSTVSMGQDIATMLLGLPTGGSYDQTASAMFYSYYGAVFAHDDWRIRPNLTLNIGIRLDHDYPYHEKWGRTVNGFDFDSSNALTSAAEAAYAKSPSALLAASAFRVRGGLTFADAKNNALYENTSHLVSPRLGLAWSPGKFHGKLAVRSGFAMFVQPITIASLAVNGAYSTNPILAQEGFSQTTSMTVTNNSYLTPANTLSDPFPGGSIQTPVGSANGLTTFGGQTVNYMNPEMKSPYSVRWNVGMQYQLSPNSVLEVAYIGNHSVHIPVTFTQMNSIPRSYLSTKGTRDATLITSMTATVPNPFLGLGTATTTNTTVSNAQILSRYPQYPTGTGSFSSGVIENENNVGSSYYHSFNVRFQKRVSRGLSVIANFMQSKMIDQTTFLNDTDPVPERRISPFFRPRRIATAITYELPFGTGRPFDPHSRLLNTIIGGWQITSTYQFQLGAPLTWLNGSTTTPGDYIYYGGDLNSQPRNVDGKAFNTSVFETASANQLQYHLRTFSSAFANVRADGTNDLSGSAIKKFNLGERTSFHLRIEAFNAANHVAFAAANTTVTNSAFGTITSQANKPRMLQVVARFVF